MIPHSSCAPPLKVPLRKVIVIGPEAMKMRMMATTIKITPKYLPSVIGSVIITKADTILSKYTFDFDRHDN